MATTLTTRIQLRNDSPQNWTLHNPILYAGEFGVENGTNKFKIGNGTTPWNELPYAVGNSEALAVDNKTIDHDEEGNLFLHDWGRSYWAWNGTEYVATPVDETHPWKSNLEPRAAQQEDGTLVLGWYEPNYDTSSPVATEAYVAAAVANAGHLKRVIVAALPAADAADPNTIYMVPKSGLLGDSYDEYVLVEGKFELIGNSAADLSGYLQKVTGAAEGNLPSFGTDGVLVDSNVSAANVAAHLTNSVTHITEEEHTKLTALPNAFETTEFTKTETGTLELNKVPTSKLFVPNGEEFILFGGNAN